MTRAMIVMLSLFAFFWTGASDAASQKLTEKELQAQIREVSRSLRCAVCQSESVWESNAELALQMREIIRERLKNGESPDQIRAYFVGRYGDFILLKPARSGLNWLLWLGPVVLLFGGGCILFLWIRKWVTKTAQRSPEEILPTNEKNRKRIEQELRQLNRS